jgi:hypothetical protein
MNAVYTVKLVLSKTYFIPKVQKRQCTYNVILMSVRVTTVAVEIQYVVHNLSVCLQHSSVECSIFLSFFYKSVLLTTFFEIILTQIDIIPSVGCRSVPYGNTNKKKLKFAFHNFANAPNTDNIKRSWKFVQIFLTTVEMPYPVIV